MANARVLVLQDVRVLVQEDAGDAIVRGERAELERVTGTPAAPHDVEIRTAGEGRGQCSETRTEFRTLTGSN